MKKQWMYVLVICFTFGLTGCQNFLGGSDDQVDSRLTNNNDLEFFNKSGLMACAGGAALGSAACLLKSGNKTYCAIAAAIAGCGLGIGANAYLENQRLNYASDEEYLDALTNDLKNENSHLQSASKTAKAVMADDKKKLAQIQSDIKKNTLNKEAAEAQLTGIDANINVLRKNLTAMKEREAEWRDISAKTQKEGLKTAQLNAQISTMQQEIQALEQEMDSLYSQRSAIKLS